MKVLYSFLFLMTMSSCFGHVTSYGSNLIAAGVNIDDFVAKQVASPGTL